MGHPARTASVNNLYRWPMNARKRLGISMDMFLPTLVQTITAVLGILLAAITAYFVFLQSKSAEFDDQIAAERTKIHNDIAQLQGHWRSTLTTFMPPGFMDRFSANNREVRGAELVNRLTLSVTFQDESLLSSFTETAYGDNADAAHVQSRAYFVALDEALKVLSAEQQLAPHAFVLGAAEPRMAGTFPGSPGELGYEEWRREFDIIGTALRVLQSQETVRVSDFKAFLKRRPALLPYVDYYEKDVRDFFSTVESVRAHILNIDSLEVSRSQYYFQKRVSFRPLLALIISAAVVGILVPLFLITTPPLSMTSLAANTMLLASFTLTVGSLILFGVDVARPLRPEPKAYVVERWLRAITADVGGSEMYLVSGATLSAEHIEGLLKSDEAGRLPPSLLESLGNYGALLEKYNSATEALDAAVVRQLLSDPELKPFKQETKSCSQSISLQPSDVLSPDRMEQIKRRVLETRQVCFIVATPRFWGSKTEGTFYLPYHKRDVLTGCLDRLAERVAIRSAARDFDSSRESLFKVLPGLKIELKNFLGN